MTVVLVADPAHEPTGHPVAPRFLRLLDEGWDTHLVLIGAGAKRLERVLPAETRERVHGVSSPGRPEKRSASRRDLFRTGLGRGARSEAQALRSLIAGLGADLVHLPSAAIADCWLESTNGLPSSIVLSICGGDLDPDALSTAYGHRRLWERAAALCVESHGMAQLASRYGAPSAKTRVVPPVADLELAPEADPRNDGDAESFRILSIGPLSWTQGYEHALVAVDLLRQRGIPCHYRIIGRGRFDDAVAFARYQLGLENTVEILPVSRPEKLREHLAWAHAYLNSAVTASSPKHLLDAQARGVPVVTTEAPPAGPTSALVVPAYDPQALADALELLATDTGLRERMAREGREKAARRNAATEQLDQFFELYSAVRSGAIA